MSVPSEHVQRATAMARLLATQGYFAKAKAGDERGASYFARMVASRVNPTGDPTDWGWLKKTGGGFHVEGYADGAIVFGNDPSNRNNVLKIVTQVGSTDPAAIQIGSAVQERRESDIWASPVPLPDALPAYLGGSPVPVPIPVTIPPFPSRDVVVEFVVGPLSQFYQAKGRAVVFTFRDRLVYVDFEGIVVWMAEYLRRCQLGESGTDASRHVLDDVAAAWR